MVNCKWHCWRCLFFLATKYVVQLDQSSAMSHQSVTDLYAFLSCLVQPDTTTGDIVFVLQLKENAKFKRKGDDLFVEHTLSLTEALCGFQFPLTHLDGRQLLIKSSPGEIVKSGNCSSVFQTLLVGVLWRTAMAFSCPRRVAMAHVSIGLVLSCEFFKSYKHLV